MSDNEPVTGVQEQPPPPPRPIVSVRIIMQEVPTEKELVEIQKLIPDYEPRESVLVESTPKFFLVTAKPAWKNLRQITSYSFETNFLPAELPSVVNAIASAVQNIIDRLKPKKPLIQVTKALPKGPPRR